MKAFVTGGTGFIGSHLTDALIGDERWDEIRCLVRTREKWLSGKSYQRIDGDLHNLPVLREALKGVDVVFHLAAIVKAPSEKEFYRGNVEATENLIRTARKAGVQKIITLSSLAAAGPSRQKPLREEDEMNPVSLYGESKKRMEEVIREITGPTQTVTILRPPAVYGPREDQIYTWFKLANKRIAPIIGNGDKPQLSMIYISDLIRGILSAVERNRPGSDTFYITGPNLCTWDQIKRITEKVLGKRSLPLYIQPGLVKKIAGFVETTASYFGSYPVLNREKANELVLEWTCSGEKAEQILGFTPEVSLEEGISRTLHWYKKHHWL
ncbi:MAG: NAD-dependent epimerase/dehydratase family protein [Balneolaceae bacterium]